MVTILLLSRKIFKTILEKIQIIHMCYGEIEETNASKVYRQFIIGTNFTRVKESIRHT